MLVLLARHWWILAIRGAIAVLFGISTLVFPKDTLTILLLALAAYALIDGLVTGTASLNAGARAWPALLEAVLGLACGVTIVLWPSQSIRALIWVISGWALITGLIELVLGLSLRRELANELWLAGAGAISILLGVVLFAWPDVGVLTLAWLIGAYAFVFGVLLIGLSARLRPLSHGGYGDSARSAAHG